MPRDIRESDSSSIIGYCAVGLNITEDTMVKEAQRESGEMYRTLFDHVPVGIGITDLKGNVIAANQSMLDLKGFTLEELKNTLVDIVYENPDDRKRLLDILADYGEASDFEVTLRRKDASTYHALLNVKLIELEGEKHLLAAVRDVTQCRHEKDALLKAKAELESKVMERTQDLAAANADLRSKVEELEATKLALQREKAYAEMLIETANAIVIVLDASGRVEVFSSTAERITGYRKEEVIGRAWFDIAVPAHIYPAIRRGLNAVTSRALKDAFSFESPILTKLGMELYISWRSNRVRSSNGQDGLMLIGINVTEHKRAGEAIRDSEKKYRDLIENISDVICSLNRDGDIVYISPGAKQVSGYDPDELIGKPFYDLVPDEDKDEIREGFNSILSGSQDSKELRIITKSGEIRWLRLSIRLISKYGRVYEIRGLITDITKSKIAEEQLSEAHRRLQDIIEFLPDATFVLDKDRRVTAWNKAIEEMTGVGKEDMIGRGEGLYAVPFYAEPREMLIDLVGASDEAIESRYPFAERVDNKIMTEEFIPSLFNGRGAYVWETALPLYDPEGCLIGSIESIRDITDRMKSESAMKRRDTLLSGIAVASNLLLTVQDYEAGMSQALEIMGLAAEVESICVFEAHRIAEEQFAGVKFSWTREARSSRDNRVGQIKRQNTCCGRLPSSWQAPLMTGKSVRGTAKDFDDLDKCILGYSANLMLVVPILLDGEFWGFICLCDHNPDRHWANWEVSILKAFGSCIGGAIIRKRAEDALRNSERKYKEMADTLPQPLFEMNKSGRLTFINNSAFDYFGYDESDLDDGIEACDVILTERIASCAEMLKLLTNKDLPCFECTARKKDGSTFPVMVCSSPIIRNHKVTGARGVMMDLTERKIYEEKIMASLRANDLLLKEIHHRVKNNLQVISSLLSLQSSSIQDENTIEVLRESQNRIRSMALIHERLYRSGDLSKIDFADYTRNLTSFLFRSYGVKLDLVKLRLDVEDVFLSIDKAIPCGLIINELVSNCLKHAFPGDKSGEICLNIKSEKDLLTMIVKDNGVGLKEGMDLKETNSLGLKLIETLVNQLKGKMDMRNVDGVEFRITFAA